MTQYVYQINAPVAQPGMVFDGPAGGGNDIVSVVAGANIPFGSYCELSGGLAVPVQDATTTTAFATALASSAIGIAVFDPLGVEQNYTTWQVPLALSGTVAVTNGSASITFSTNQTLAAGSLLTFASQPGVVYNLGAAVVAGTAGTLATPYTGTTAGATTTTVIGAGSTASGWLKGMAVPFMRRGRIWVAWDGGGTVTRSGPINLRHSSTGANPQGIFTFTAAQITVGNEIDIAPNCVVWNPGLASGSYTDPFGNSFKTVPVGISLS